MSLADLGSDSHPFSFILLIMGTNLGQGWGHLTRYEYLRQGSSGTLLESDSHKLLIVLLTFGRFMGVVCIYYLT